jgi:hypothetical protein
MALIGSDVGPFSRCGGVAPAAAPLVLVVLTD